MRISFLTGTPSRLSELVTSANSVCERCDDGAVADVEIEQTGEPAAWLDSVTLEGSDTPVRVVFDSRDGNRVFVRQADPVDGDPPRVPCTGAMRSW